MKTVSLTLKRKVLVIEYDSILEMEIDELLHKGLPTNDLKLLGSPDDLKEEDVADVIEKVMNDQHFLNYNSKEIWDRWCKTALESFNSALSSEIYWVNPIKINNIILEDGTELGVKFKTNEFLEAESRTFNRNRTLIFVEN